MTERYRILLTKKSFDELLKLPQTDHGIISSFLNYLIDGEWEEDSHQFNQVIVWRGKNNNRYLFTCKIKDGLYAVWETLWTVDMAKRLRLREYMEKESYHDFSPHIILLSLGEFPGQPDTVMHIGNNDFRQEGTMNRRYLKFYEREIQDEVCKYYNEELYILSRNSIEKVLNREQRGLPLHMTKEQVDILSTHQNLRGPILLSGEAGSGKTIVMTHWLLINQLEKIESQLFVTFSDRLVDSTRDTFEKMLPSNFGPHQVRFLTYRELLLEIANAGGLKPRDFSKEMTFERFLREYSKRVSPKIDYVLLWDEIRSTIKGGCTDPNRRMIDYSTYEQLSEKKGLCKVPKKMRKEYYSQAQSYQNYLDEHGLWDAIDLAFDCLMCVDKIPPYARIACDEVQDLAPVEILVLINIVKDKNIDNIFFTGDVAQVINPSGFTWSRLKRLLWEISKRHDISDASILGRNFRSTKEIVELVNEIVRLRKTLLKDGERNIQHSFISSGIKPMILDVDPLEVVKETISNPKERLILVKTKEEKNRVINLLKEAVEKVTVLTVEEAKGLEWEGVLLWNFFIPRHEKITKNDWENVFIREKRQSFAKLIAQGKKNPYGLVYEFNLLHVGLTRARKYLFIYDKSPLMNIKNLGESIAKRVISIDPKQFRVYWETTLPSPEEVYNLALDLLDRDQRQALAFFKIAAQGFEKIKKFKKAAQCYERIHDYNLAAKCYEKENNTLMKEKMFALDAESKKNFEEAGEHWEKYSKCAAEDGNWEEASHGYILAAKAYENARLFEKAAKTSEKRAQYFETIGEIKYRIIRAESFYNAAILWEKIDSLENAIRDITNAINIVRDEIVKSDTSSMINGKTPEVWLAESFAQLANYKIKDKKNLEAASHFMEAARWFSQAEKKVENTIEKENYFELQITHLRKAIELYKKTEKLDTALDVLKNLVNLLKDRRKKHDLMKTWEDLIKLLRESGKIGEYINETTSYMKYLRDNDERDRCYKVAKIQVNWCKENAFFEEAIKLMKIMKEYYEKDREYVLVGQMLEEIGETQKLINEQREAITSFIEAGRNYLKDGYLKGGMESFKKGLETAISEMSPSSVGWYCFKEVAVDSLITKYIENAKEWIEKGVEFFFQEYGIGVKRVQGYIRICEEKILRMNDFPMKDIKRIINNKETIKSIREKYKEIKEVADVRREVFENMRRCGWAWLCLGLLYQKGPSTDEWKAKEAFENSIQYFSMVENHDMVSYIEKKVRKFA